MPAAHTGMPVLPVDQAATLPQKIAAIVRSKLGLNTTVFARSCQLQKVDKVMAAEFLNRYHLMNAAQSAYQYGLFYENELVAIATFSKGRKMDRLPEQQRSFELIRFCCKAGITVTGGLTRLVKNFAIEKKAGDIMTYVDKQLSDGKAFVQAGFKKSGESRPVQFLVRKTTLERTYYTGEKFDAGEFYLLGNSGNLKLIYTPLERI